MLLLLMMETCRWAGVWRINTDGNAVDTMCCVVNALSTSAIQLTCKPFANTTELISIAVSGSQFLSSLIDYVD